MNIRRTNVPGPKSLEEFHAAIGLAILNWSRVEAAFREVFIRLVLCGLSGKGLGEFQGEGFFLLGTVFDTTGNLPGRLSLIDHMVNRLVSDDTLRAEWKSIKKQSVDLLTDRNVLVHGEAWDREESGLPQYMRYSLFSKNDKEMDFEDVVRVASRFLEYADRINEFAKNANAHLARRDLPSPTTGSPIGP